jgi:hypothetical protein
MRDDAREYLAFIDERILCSRKCAPKLREQLPERAEGLLRKFQAFSACDIALPRIASSLNEKLRQ